MVHRDPETGQYVSDDTPAELGLQYADFEFQHIRGGNVSPSGDTGDNSSDRSYEVLGGDLQHDEVAMLANIRAVLVTEVTESPAADSQDEAGAYGGKAELGINIDGSERFTSDQRDLNFGDEDNPGILSVLATGSSSTPFVDTSAGAGGGGGAPHDRQEINFMELYGSGPFLDKADDLTVRVESNAQNSVVEITSTVWWTLGFLVYEMENVRPTFGAPR
jgi:hypothetical protein